jgi:WD40 repeat protein
MSEAKPCILLAVANSAEQPLPRLGQEFNAISAALAEASQLCEVKALPFATPETIIAAFTDPNYYGRIVALHYAGHANAYELLLEGSREQNAVTSAGSVAAFLAKQPGLKLVFLNACSTEGHVKGLLEANVPAVIATHSNILDDVAASFSQLFYTNLANRYTLNDAYELAVASVGLEKGDRYRNIRVNGTEVDYGSWPGKLHFKPGAESLGDDFSFAKLAGDPLIGLPALPEKPLPEKPYRAIYRFEKDHAELFFGRGQKIRELFDKVTSQSSAPIILLYGPSGVGKSSLLDAGLLPRLEGATITTRYARRDANFGLLETLKKALGVQGDDIAKAWQQLETTQPVVVVLDQLEEAYTQPLADKTIAKDKELDTLATALQTLFNQPDSKPKGKLILSFRKEWLQEIGKVLKEKNLFITEVELSALKDKEIEESVSGPERSKRLKNHYGLSVESGLSKEIADDLSSDPDSPIAPILQIMLTQMWDEAWAKKSETDGKPYFSRQLYLNYKKEQGLGQILDEQLHSLKAKNKDAVESGFALDLLHFHTTEKDTARERTAEELKTAYPHREDLVAVASEFKWLYVLSDPKESSPKAEELSSTRLAHDTLAPLIRQRFTMSSALGQRAQRLLKNKVTDWQNSKEATFDEADLAIVEAGLDGMRKLTTSEEELITSSKQKREERIRQEQEHSELLQKNVVIQADAKKAREEAEAEQLKQQVINAEKLRATEENARKKTRWWLNVALGFLGIATVAAIFAFVQQGAAKREANRANEQTVIADKQRNLALSNSLIKQARDNESLRPDQALLLYKEASVKVSNLDTDSTANEDLKKYISTANFPKQLQHIVHAHGVNNTKEPRVADLAFSPTSSILASAGLDGEIFLWDITNDHLSNRRELTNENNPSHGSDGSQDVDRLAFNPSGNYLASGGRDNWVILWDVTKGTGEACEADTQNTAPEDYVTAVAFNETSTLVASGHHSGEIRLWSITDSNCKLSVKKSFKDIQKLSPQPMDSRENVERVLNVVFNKNNLWVIFSGGLIVSLDVTTTDLDVSLRCKVSSNEEDRYSSAFYESKSQSIFLATTTGSVFYFSIIGSDCDKSDWRLATDETAGEIFDIAFSQPQRRFAFGRQKNDTLDVFGHPEENGSNLIDISPQGLTQPIYSVAFDKDGIFFASGDDAGNIFLWKLDHTTENNISQERACELVGRNLSQDEWKNIADGISYSCTCPAFPPGEGIDIQTLSDSSQCQIN